MFFTIMVKTTPENVKEANEGLFHAKMNLPEAATHCGMTNKEMKMTFREYLKYCIHMWILINCKKNTIKTWLYNLVKNELFMTLNIIAA